MKQITFGDIEHIGVKKTKKAKFLEKMDETIPWSDWVEMIRPYYNNELGRKAKDIEVMLRMYLLQNWYNLSDENAEEEIIEGYSFRKFVGINLLKESVPDATTLLKFRHIIEENNLGEKFLNYI